MSTPFHFSLWPKTKKSAVQFVYFLYKKIRILSEHDSWFFCFLVTLNKKRKTKNGMTPTKNRICIKSNIMYFQYINYRNTITWIMLFVQCKKKVQVWLVASSFLLVWWKNCSNYLVIMERWMTYVDKWTALLWFISKLCSQFSLDLQTS